MDEAKERYTTICAVLLIPNINNELINHLNYLLTFGTESKSKWKKKIMKMKNCSKEKNLRNPFVKYLKAIYSNIMKETNKLECGKRVNEYDNPAMAK